jgi:hypothetical protein
MSTAKSGEKLHDNLVTFTNSYIYTDQFFPYTMQMLIWLISLEEKVPICFYMETVTL